MSHTQRLNSKSRTIQSNSLVFIFLLFFVPFAFSQEKKAKPAVEEKLEGFEKTFVDNNIAFSIWLDRLAEKIDLFLVGKKVSAKKNETNIRVQNSTFKAENTPFINTFNISVNPRFPNLEDYFQLKFSSTDDERNEARKGVSQNLKDQQTEKKYEASLGLFRNLGDIQTTFQPRVALGGSALKLSHSLNFSSAYHYRKSLFNPKLELFADADKGVGFFNSLNFSFTLSPIYYLTLINDAEYLDRVHSYTVNNGFSVGQYVTDKISYNYSLIFTSLNQPRYHLESYLVAFAWNQLIYKRILDFQAIPQLDFRKENGFKGSLGMTFNINLNF